MTPEELVRLVHSLTALPKETEWLEFKLNNWNPDEIGQNMSGVSNGAALHRQPMAYLVWGVENEAHRIEGTTFRPRSAKKGNENLEAWLARMLEPRIDFRIHEGQVDEKPVVVFEVPPATHMPVCFAGWEYIRVGPNTKPLSDYTGKERALWAIFSAVPFEAGVAVANASSDDVLELIDYPEYFRVMEQPLPDNRAAILAKLTSEKIIHPGKGDRYDITNVGAILFARSLKKFDRLARKALRVVIYRGDSRVETVKEQQGDKGYAVGFEGAVDYINDQLPQNEQVNRALRSEVRMYPEIAVRELIANALIHQDFNVTGAGPLVELFSHRMEISNPGVPLIDTLRFIDEPPRSRNEALAALMRRIRICEERGSGIDKVIFAVETFQLPAPDFRVAGASTVAVLFGPRSFAEMDREERIRACYQHGCLQCVSGKRMSNATLRQRLGIDDANYPLASRVIRDTIRAGLVKPYGQGTSPRTASYVPYWA